PARPARDADRIRPDPAEAPGRERPRGARGGGGAARTPARRPGPAGGIGPTAPGLPVDRALVAKATAHRERARAPRPLGSRPTPPAVALGGARLPGGRAPPGGRDAGTAGDAGPDGPLRPLRTVQPQPRRGIGPAQPRRVLPEAARLRPRGSVLRPTPVESD